MMKRRLLLGLMSVSVTEKASRDLRWWNLILGAVFIVCADTRASLMDRGDGDSEGESGTIFLPMDLYTSLIASSGIKPVGNTVGTLREKGPEVVTVVSRYYPQRDKWGCCRISSKLVG